MAGVTRKTEADDIAELEGRSLVGEIGRAEITVNRRSQSSPSASPFSVRLSPPLLEQLDRLAKKENRKRGNLIQTILWEYVHKHS